MSKLPDNVEIQLFSMAEQDNGDFTIAEDTNDISCYDVLVRICNPDDCHDVLYDESFDTLEEARHVAVAFGILFDAECEEVGG